jgi:excisionase family DNA binding protein
MEKVTYSVNEACNATSLGRTTLYQLINTGQLVTIKQGRRRLITADSVKAWLETNAIRNGDQS